MNGDLILQPLFVNIKEEKQNCMWNLFACSIVVKVREWNCILNIYTHVNG